jgi:hypothetical protein
MKAAGILIVLGLALTGCQEKSPSTVEGSPTGVAVSGRSGEMKAAAEMPPTVANQAFGAAPMVARPTGYPADAAAESGQAEAQSGPDPLQNVNASTATPAMVIRTGQAFVEVQKLDPAVLRIRQLAAQVGGYIANSSMSGGRDQIRQATLEIKIPSARYDDAVNSLASIGKVETVNSQAQDVGEEFVDVTARVANARRLEERLITLLSNRTGKLDEVLRVERELARVREEIERYEGRLRYLGVHVATSTLTVTVHEPTPIIGNSPGENPIAAALRRAWVNFVALLSAVIASMGVLIPLGLAGLAGWGGYRRWKRVNL